MSRAMQALLVLAVSVVAGCSGAGDRSGSGGSSSGDTVGGGGGTGSGGGTGLSATAGAVGSGGAEPGGTGGASAVAGTRAMGGVPATGGSRSSSGSGGRASTGGARTGGARTGGATAGGATAGAAGSTAAGGATAGSTAATGGSGGGTACDIGSSTTTWAASCPSAPPTTCTPGTWTAGGPDPDHGSFRLLAESEHFAVYSDESPTGAQAAVDHLETVWKTYFASPMYMREPLCSSATKVKASVHVHSDWGLTGGSWAAGRMGMWIGTAGLGDHWGLAHEFMHGVQAVQGGQACGSGANTCGWVHESHANWAAHQQTEYHTKDVHCSELLVNATHLYLGSTRDRYCNWQFLEYLKDKHCMSAVNAIWTGKAARDPFTAIMNNLGWSLGQLNDFMGEWAMHNVTWDYQDPPPQSTTGNHQGALYRAKYGLVTDTSKNNRRLRLTKVEPLDSDYASHRRFFSPFAWAPQRYGYNIIRLYPEAGATRVTVTFRGITSAPSSPDWRWGLVATDAGLLRARYSPVQKGADGTLAFCVNAGEPLFLVVVATPSAWYDIIWDQPYNTVPRYPFMIQLANAWPDGFASGKPDACPSGTVRVSNGGGCGPAGLAATVYVGPHALVTGSGVSGAARIEGHAQVQGGVVKDATIGALTLLGSAFSVTGAETKAETTFMPLDFFEGRSLTGGALVGDVELRASRSSGTCSGFVDAATCTAPGTDKTPAPPYTWRE